MNPPPKELTTDLANLLRDHSATGLYGMTLGLLGDQILPFRRDKGTAAMVDARAIHQLVRAYGMQGHLGLLAPVLELIEPYLSTLQRDPILIGASPRRGPHHPALMLTAREMAVLVGMANGMTNARIGRAMGPDNAPLTEDTIKTHARAIYKKLQANDRAHAVRLAFDAGLLRAYRDAAVAS